MLCLEIRMINMCVIFPADTCWLHLLCSSYANLLPARLSRCNNFPFPLSFSELKWSPAIRAFLLGLQNVLSPFFFSLFQKQPICVVSYPFASSLLGLCLLNPTLHYCHETAEAVPVLRHQCHPLLLYRLEHWNKWWKFFGWCFTSLGIGSVAYFNVLLAVLQGPNKYLDWLSCSSIPLQLIVLPEEVFIPE